MEISIIVPVFNSENYLERCLDSLYSQRFSGTFEVIAVDDGSTDHSPDLLKAYREKEKGLRIITQEYNKKLSVARVTGMEAASGDYIMHVDSDDCLEQDALEKLYTKCISSGADVLVFNVLKVDTDGKRVSLNAIKKELTTQNKLEVLNHFYGATVNKIVKRKLTFQLHSGSIGINTTEDLVYCIEVLLRADTICLLPEHYYEYYANEGSLTWTVSTQSYLCHQVTILEMLASIFSKYNTDSSIILGTLTYVEKWIFMMLAESRFVKKERPYKIEGLMEVFNLFPEVSAAHHLRLMRSYKYKYYALYQVILNFSLRTALGIIFRSRKNWFKY